MKLSEELDLKYLNGRLATYKDLLDWRDKAGELELRLSELEEEIKYYKRKENEDYEGVL